MDEQLGAVLAVCVTFGIIAALISYSKTHSGGSAVFFFFFGTLFPLIGLVVALLIKPAQGPPMPPMPPGWYPDPWDQRLLRWYDSRQWTYHTQPLAQSQPYR